MGSARDPGDVDPHLGEPRELSARTVELAVGGDDARAFAKRQRGKEANEQLVGVRTEGDAAARVSEESRVARPHSLGAGARRLPLVVDEARGGVDRASVPFPRTVGPRLVGVAGEQEPVSDVEARVVAGDGVGVGVQLGGGRNEVHRRSRIAQRSGNTGSNRVSSR